jgi:hypothetical protein
VCCAVRPVTAQRSGDGVVTGGAELLFKGGEFVEMVGLTLVHFLWAALDDSADTHYPGHNCYGSHPCAEESDVDIAAAQVGSSLGYFVLPGLAVSGRIVLNGSDRYHGGGAAGGLGPEITYYFAADGGLLSPFVGAGFLYTRTLRGGRNRLQEAGSTVLLKGGIHARINGATGFFAQVTHHNSRRSNAIGERQARWGLGFGYSGFF